MKFKGDFKFQIKDNAFDDLKAFLLNEFIKLVEKKVLVYKENCRRHSPIDEEQFYGISPD